MKGIEIYIQFAIDNDFDFNRDLLFIDFNKVKFIINKYTHEVRFYDNNGCTSKIDLIKLITSKPFIEAVVRGLNPTMKIGSMGLNIEIDGITAKQAIAIRDNKLEEFINNLLPKE